MKRFICFDCKLQNLKLKIIRMEEHDLSDSLADFIVPDEDYTETESEDEVNSDSNGGADYEADTDTESSIEEMTLDTLEFLEGFPDLNQSVMVIDQGKNSLYLLLY